MEDGADSSPPAPAASDGEGFGELYRGHVRPLLGMAIALTGSRERSEEVVQQAFATTFDHYRRLDDPVRSTRRSVLRGCTPLKSDPDDADRASAFKAERILSRVRSLPRAERDAVALRYSLDLDAPEIDATLGLEPGTAALRLHEAGTKLRSSLEVGDDLDRALSTAFAESTAGLGHLLARPGEAQRRVYRRRRVRLGVLAAAAVVAVVVAALLLGRGSPQEQVSTGTTDTAATSDAVDTAVSATDAPGSTDAPSTSSPVATTAPADTTTTTAAAAEGTYTVVSGDGWYAIATKLDVPVESLLQVNGATVSTPLSVGQVLKVPPRATA